MKLLKRLIVYVLIIILVIVALEINAGYRMFREAIEETSLEEKVQEIKNISNYTKIDEVPEIYLKAVVAAEDHRFYSHKGIDLISICGAILYDLRSKSLAVGGSTITQQLAKNSYFTQDKKLTRKIAEIFMANEYEKNYEKDEILELYLNTSYYGDGCYTVKEASRKFFNKEPIEMNDYESTMLAGVPNAPSVYAPTINLDLAKKRQSQVLQKMVSHEVITEEQAEEILKLERYVKFIIW